MIKSVLIILCLFWSLSLFAAKNKVKRKISSSTNKAYAILDCYADNPNVLPNPRTFDVIGKLDLIQGLSSREKGLLGGELVQVTYVLAGTKEDINNHILYESLVKQIRKYQKEVLKRDDGFMGCSERILY